MNKRAALCAASYRGDIEDVNQLLQQSNIDIDEKDGIYEDRPLTLAAFSGHLHIVQVLFAHGANVEVANMQGDTALMLAARKGHWKIVKYLLLKCTANVSAKNCTG